MANNKNMDDLMQAAQLKLKAQQKEQQSEISGDIYAEMRNEMDDIDYPDTVIQRSPNSNYGDFDIKNQMDEYPDEYYIDPNDTPVFEGGPGLSQIDIWKKQFGVEKVFHTQILEKHEDEDSLDHAGLMDTCIKLELVWNFCEYFSLSGYVAYSDFLFDRHIRQASRYYEAHGHWDHSYNFIGGIALNFEF